MKHLDGKGFNQELELKNKTGKLTHAPIIYEYYRVRFLLELVHIIPHAH